LNPDIELYKLIAATLLRAPCYVINTEQIGYRINLYA